MPEALIESIVPRLAAVPGVAAIVLGGARARGTATPDSDYDLGLYYGSAVPIDTDRLHDVVTDLVDDPATAAVTAVGDWGPQIVGGGWLRVGGRKVDLLYRSCDAVADVIQACRAGTIAMDYQPGHPHGFCSAIWMGEIALCVPLHDPKGEIGILKAMTAPYPEPLRDAPVRRFQWEILFSIENGEKAVPRGEQTHVAGCVYRTLCCIAQVLFALNLRYLINEKGALDEAARFALTLADLPSRLARIWRAVGAGTFDAAFAELRALDAALRTLGAKAG
jgi:hypothetical protein